MATRLLPENEQLNSCVAQDDILVGPLRTPSNSSRHLGAGSIHDDATAQKLGFRGGTVAGSLHMEQLPPLAEALFGEQWWQQGGMSMYFRYATADQEPVRCFADQLRTPTQTRSRVWIEDTEDHLVAEGTLNTGGPDPDSPLQQRIRQTAEPQDIRILAHVAPGSRSERISTRVSSELVSQRLSVITEPMTVYQGSQPYLPPSLVVRILRAGEQQVLPRSENTGVGLFGAIEIQHVNGPVLAEKDYDCVTEVICLGETPKTEYLWYRSTLLDGDKEVAFMLMMLRFMKASSPLWQEK
ncbi:MAG: hypothetical protein KDI36_12480 [Pseudomonadales bacterium]|nr:hypothetical protein [Pseudomonadales bacterium]